MWQMLYMEIQIKLDFLLFTGNFMLDICVVVMVT